MRRGAALLAVAALAGCGGGSDDGDSSAPRHPMVVGSHAFFDGRALPKRFTCDGRGVSPPLSWRDVPEKARDLMLIVEDMDVPVGAFTHWTVCRLPFGPLGAGRLLENNVPPEVDEGINDAGDRGWAPACPPKGDGPHHYVFTLYALDERAQLTEGAPASQARAAAAASMLAQARVSATYDR
jgi:Raf kinase inhibitor-like YbhB/YbcL family protein